MSDLPINVSKSKMADSLIFDLTHSYNKTSGDMSMKRTDGKEHIYLRNGQGKKLRVQRRCESEKFANC